MVRKRILFESKVDLEWRFTSKELRSIKSLWSVGKGISFISQYLNRNEHEVFLALYEMWMDGKVDDIGRAFRSGSSLLVPGKEQLKNA